MKNFCFLVLCIFSSPAISQVINWDGKRESISIDKNIFILKEEGSPLSIEQVSGPSHAGKFIKSDQAILNFGYSESVYWIKLLINNTGKTAPLLELAQPQVFSVTFFYKDTTGHWRSYQAGSDVPLTEKVIKSHVQLFPLTQTGTEYYVRLRNGGKPIPVSLWDKSTYESKILVQLITYGIYIGLLGFVIFYNLFFFLSLQRVIYLHYAFLVFMYAVFAAVIDGYILYLFPDIELQYLFTINPIINQPNGLLYSLFFLEVWKYSPKLYKFSLIVAAYFISYIIWYAFLPLTIVSPLNEAHALLGISLMAFLGYRVGKQGNKLGYYFAFAYCLFFVVAGVEIIYLAIGNPSYLLDISHVSVGIFIEVFILAYALSKRIEWERDDIIKAKTDVQQQLLAKTQENEQLLRVQNETLEHEVTERTKVIAHKSLELQKSLETLKATQDQLIQKEKMASLGELTAGIAHEIQNPLNFVNNFSAVSTELVTELEEERQKTERDVGMEVEILGDLKLNLQKITHHGGRASAIVRGMLEHSRTGAGEKQLTNLNALTDEYLKIAYHGLRAKEKDRKTYRFNCELITKFDPDLPWLNIVPQEIGQVLLNLYNNAFYAVQQKQKTASDNYRPVVTVHTRRANGYTEIRISDNGTGIAESVKAKIFQPFFTTKPAGEGTGLGLSLSYDIITKGHGGTLLVESQEGIGTEFVVQLPPEKK